MAAKLAGFFQAAAWHRGTLISIWLATAAVFLLMLADWGWAAYQMGHPMAVGAPQLPPAQSLKSQARAGSFEEFERAFSSRNLFQSGAAVVQTAEVFSIDSEIAALELAGILIGTHKQVIFRDRNTKETFFVEERQKVRNLTVKEIRGHSVIVSARGEEREMRVEE